MAELRLFKNNFGLLKTECGKWAVRQVGGRMWAVQTRDNADDPCGWKILAYEETQEEAVKHMIKAKERKHEIVEEG